MDVDGTSQGTWASVCLGVNKVKPLHSTSTAFHIVNSYKDTYKYIHDEIHLLYKIMKLCHSKEVLQQPLSP
jgi:hypothetical protein